MFKLLSMVSIMRTRAAFTGAALPENNKASAELTTANGGTFYFVLSQTQ